MTVLCLVRKHAAVFLSRAELPWQNITKSWIDVFRALQLPRPWLNVSFVLSIRVGRWAGALWTLTFEPRGHMSPEAIFEAHNYTGQLGGLHTQTTARIQNTSKSVPEGEQRNDVFSLNRQHFSLTRSQRSHPPTLCSTLSSFSQRPHILMRQRLCNYHCDGVSENIT